MQLSLWKINMNAHSPPEGLGRAWGFLDNEGFAPPGQLGDRQFLLGAADSLQTEAGESIGILPNPSYGHCWPICR